MAKTNSKGRLLFWLCVLVWIDAPVFPYRIIDFDPQRISRFDTPGAAYDVAVSGHYAYVADGSSGVQVLDISDPANLRRVGGYDTVGRCVSLTMSTNLVYVADGDAGVQIVDFTKPEEAKLVATIPTSNWVGHVAVSGQYAYVAARGEGLVIVNISAPAAPKKVATYKTTNLGNFVSVVYPHVYIDGGNRRPMEIIDVSNPAQPRFENQLVNTFWPVQDGLFTPILGAVLAGDLQLVSLADPNNPSVLKYYTPKDSVLGAFHSARLGWFKDKSAMVIAGIGGLEIVNLWETIDAYSLARYDTYKYTPVIGMTVAGDTAFLAEGEEGIEVVNLNVPANPQRVFGMGNEYFAGQNLAVSSDFAYLDDYNELRVFDIGNVLEPKLMGKCTLSQGGPIAVNSGYAYVAAGGNDVKVVDARDASHPRESGAFNPGGSVEDMVVLDGRLYAATSTGLKVFDLSVPVEPKEALSLPELGLNAWCVRTVEKTLYVCALGFHVIDVRDPQNPRITGSFKESSGYFTKVDVLGDYAFLIDRYDAGAVTRFALKIVDMSDRTAMKQVGMYDLGSEPIRDIKMIGGYLYLASGSGIRVLDVSDPTKPKMAGKNLSDSAGQLFLKENKVLTVSSQTGLVVYDSFHPQKLAVTPTENNEGFHFEFTGLPGVRYWLQKSTNLNDWIDWRQIISDGIPLLEIDEQPTGRGGQFYRAVVK